LLRYASLAVEPRRALDEVVRLAPRHQGALLELERVLARTGDHEAHLDLWSQLADVIDDPERRIAYWLEVAAEAADRDAVRAESALARAAARAAAPPGRSGPRAP